MKMRASFELTQKEKRVYASMPELGKDNEPTWISITDIAKKAWAKKGSDSLSKPNSWTRNSMRKLLKLGLVKNKDYKSGLYSRTKLTPEGVLAKAEKDGVIRSESAEAKVTKAAKAAKSDEKDTEDKAA